MATGLPARVRLTAFSQRTVDVVEGTVITVSADRLTDPATRVPYYLAKIRLDEASIPAAVAGRITPGMGVEVMIRTGERTLFQYLTKPLRDSISRSLTED
ncbi:MAG: HlyD family secretion protein [Proteobacteria bacterium]|nr:HlyD family secretion protein [Pseudomonadota bacterium]